MMAGLQWPYFDQEIKTMREGKVNHRDVSLTLATKPIPATIYIQISNYMKKDEPTSLSQC